MRLIFWPILFIVSCSSNSLSSSKHMYEVMNDLWQNKANKSEVISALGANYQTVSNGITYSFLTFNYPKSGHFFSQTDQLIIQFIFLEEKEFETFKTKVKCPWEVVRKKDSSGHAIKTIEYGTCKSLNITYKYPSNLNTYEIRWEKL